ncbi:MAG: AAA family ATPase [Proteobacteria bacterium]|nr:AAA family ATPase [Pseudomonadota bacterium]
MNAKDIAQALEDHAAEIAAYLLPQGKKAGPEWKAGSTRGDAGQSLSVRISGAKRGVWQDFATGDKGDLLDLWAAVRGGSVADAMREAAQYLGLSMALPTREDKTYRRPQRPADVAKPKAGARDWLLGRGLTAETLEAFKIGEQIHGGKTYAVFPYLRDGELVNAKTRNIADKRDMRQESGAEPCLFGWHLIDPKERQIVLTEGEIDAMTLHQCGIPALSCNAGAGNHQWIESDWERLARFSDIVVAYDGDEAGQKGAQEIARRLGFERCRIATFPGYKDANEALQGGEDGEFFWEALKAAKSVDPAELQSFTDFIGKVKSMLYPASGGEDDGSYALSIGDQRHDWLRFRRGEISVWTGINGHGKSLLLSQTAVQLADQGARWCIFSGEMQPAMQAKRLVKQAAGLDRPSLPYIDAIGEWLRDRMWVVATVGSAKLERLLEIFTYANRRYGCNQFVLDSLMMIDIPEDGPGAFSAQKKAVQMLADFAKRHDGHVHLVAHPRKGRDEKESPGKMDVAGSSKITDGADNVLSVWSAKRDPDAPNYKPEEIDGRLSLHKQRNGDVQERSIPLWLDRGSQQFCPTPRRRTVQFVPFSRETVA